MVIDIDSFLEKYEKKEDSTKINTSKKVSLDFQKDVEDKLHQLDESAKNIDFKQLVDIYEEIKRFDEDLPSKFFSMNKLSGATLKGVGARYSEDFLEGLKKNIERYNEFLRDKFVNIDKALESDKFSEALNQYNEANKQFKNYPKEFFNEKTELGHELKRREIVINEKFEIFKHEEIKRIKRELFMQLQNLKSELVPLNIKLIEERIDKINRLWEKVPKVFFTDLIKERVQSAKALMIAEEFLQKEYTNDFEDKQNTILKLFEKFHKYYLRKDVNNTIATYDEISLTFEDMPNVFLEKKVELYKQISQLFNSINDLIMTSNVNLFLEMYNNSKILQEAREYLNHITRTNKIDMKILLDLTQKLKGIPEKLSLERNDLIEEIGKYITKEQIKIKSREKIEEKVANPKLKTETKDSKQEINSTEEKTSSRPTLSNTNTRVIEKVHIDESKQKKPQTTQVTKNIMEEINQYYNRLKQSSDKKEMGVLYKKINFYLSLIPIKESAKKEIIVKVNKVIHNKKIS